MTRDEWLKAFAGEYQVLDPRASADAAMEAAQQCYFPELNPRFAARRQFQINPLPLRTSEPRSGSVP
jgi:hypothetical protein